MGAGKETKISLGRVALLNQSVSKSTVKGKRSNNKKEYEDGIQ